MYSWIVNEGPREILDRITSSGPPKAARAAIRDVVPKVVRLMISEPLLKLNGSGAQRHEGFALRG